MTAQTPIRIEPAQLLKQRERGVVLDRFGNRARTTPRTKGRTTAELVRQSNAWRDGYNPLRGLVISRIVTLLEAYDRGEMAEVQWLFQKMERRYPVLKGCVKRARAAVSRRKWDYKIQAEPPKGLEKLAKEQQAALREAYEGVDNMREAIRRLAHAQYRGFAILNKHRRPDGSVREFHWLPEWNWVRDGMFGDWYYNQDARATSAVAFQDDVRIGAGLPREDFLIMECESPINEVALVAYGNALMGVKDWAGFVEIFGLPGAVVTMPPNDVTDENQADYESSANSVAEGGTGTIPYGATVTFPSSQVRGLAPFKEFLSWHEKDVVIAATGGKLTMLTESGSGTLAGGAHQDTWDEIVEGDCQDISEVFQQNFDREILDAEFPGRPHLAYFEIEAISNEDSQSITKVVTQLASSGYRVKRDVVEEELGMELEEPGEEGMGVGGQVSGPESQPNGDDDAALQNRASAGSLPDNARAAFLAAVAADLAPLRDRLQAILAIQDPAIQRQKLAALRDEMEQLKADIAADPEAAKALAGIEAAAMINGFAGQPLENRRAGKAPVDGAGRPVDASGGALTGD